MKFMQNKLSIEIIWQDTDMIELKIIASNDNFSGATEIYTVYEDIDTLAKSLKGFPKSISESIEFSAGQRDSYAFANIRFYCFTGGKAVLDGISPYTQNIV